MIIFTIKVTDSEDGINQEQMTAKVKSAFKAHKQGYVSHDTLEKGVFDIIEAYSKYLKKQGYSDE